VFLFIQAVGAAGGDPALESVTRGGRIDESVTRVG